MATATASSVKLKPLYDRILVRRIQEDEKTRGGIIIPDTAREKPVIGEVVAVGKGKKNENGEYIPLEVKVGDIVTFGKYAGTETPRRQFEEGGEEFVVMREEEVLGILEK